ncbi:hypothetical protein FS749_011575 [Ceratobasidium sp. UAMH 11750]|nr:hypothetical protein FS749_011575 [Ceratobasidium sp. UAMH 11750]
MSEEAKTPGERHRISKKNRTQPYAHHLAALRRLAGVLGADVTTVAGRHSISRSFPNEVQNVQGEGSGTQIVQSTTNAPQAPNIPVTPVVGKRQRDIHDIGGAENHARTQRLNKASSASGNLQPNIQTQVASPAPPANQPLVQPTNPPPNQPADLPADPPPGHPVDPPPSPGSNSTPNSTPNRASSPAPDLTPNPSPSRGPSSPSHPSGNPPPNLFAAAGSSRQQNHGPNARKSTSSNRPQKNPRANERGGRHGVDPRTGDRTAEDDCMSDAETIVSVYEDPHAPSDQTIVHILTLLEALVKRVDEILTKPPQPAPANPPPTGERIPVPKPYQSKRRANPPVWDQTIDDNRPAGARTREPARTAVLVYIRSCFLRALGLGSPKEHLPPGPTIDVEAPTIDNFYLKWDESHRSEFNRAACHLITDLMVTEWPSIFTGDNWDDLFQMVSGHAKYLIRRYRREQLPPEDESERKRHLASSANRRMHTTWENRMYVIDSVPALKTHRTLFLELGIEGTSSDEEDPENPRVYKVKRIKQLSSSVRELKQKLDEAYEVLEKGPGHRGSKGRTRVRTNEPSTRDFRIKGLPINCVNRVWYNRLTEAQKSYFKFIPYDYKFTFPDEILKM